MSGFYTGSRYLGIHIERGVCSDRGVCKIPIAIPSSCRFCGLFIDIVRVQQEDAKAKCHLVTWRRIAKASDHQNDTGTCSRNAQLFYVFPSMSKVKPRLRALGVVIQTPGASPKVSCMFRTSMHHTSHGSGIRE